MFTDELGNSIADVRFAAQLAKVMTLIDAGLQRGRAVPGSKPAPVYSNQDRLNAYEARKEAVRLLLRKGDGLSFKLIASMTNSSPALVSVVARDEFGIVRESARGGKGYLGKIKKHLADSPELSDADIAALVGCTQTYVAQIRRIMARNQTS